MGNGNMLTSSYTLTISMISVVFVSNSVWVNFRIGISIVMVQICGGGLLNGVMGSSFLAPNVQFGGFFQIFWKIFQDKGKNHQIKVTQMFGSCKVGS